MQHKLYLGLIYSRKALVSHTSTHSIFLYRARFLNCFCVYVAVQVQLLTSANFLVGLHIFYVINNVPKQYPCSVTPPVKCQTARIPAPNCHEKKKKNYKFHLKSAEDNIANMQYTQYNFSSRALFLVCLSASFTVELFVFLSFLFSQYHSSSLSLSSLLHTSHTSKHALCVSACLPLAHTYTRFP